MSNFSVRLDAISELLMENSLKNGNNRDIVLKQSNHNNRPDLSYWKLEDDYVTSHIKLFIL